MRVVWLIIWLPLKSLTISNLNSFQPPPEQHQHLKMSINNGNLLHFNKINQHQLTLNVYCIPANNNSESDDEINQNHYSSDSDFCYQSIDGSGE